MAPPSKKWGLNEKWQAEKSVPLLFSAHLSFQNGLVAKSGGLKPFSPSGAKLAKCSRQAK